MSNLYLVSMLVLVVLITWLLLVVSIAFLFGAELERESTPQSSDDHF